MKRKSDRYRKFAASPGDEISDETSTTRLHVYDLAEVKAMCVDGKTKSDVIRELVRKALYARRYRQASTDPAFKEILKSFDDQVGVRLHHLEQRLAGRMEADFGLSLSLLGYLYFTAFFNVEEVKQTRLLVTPEGVSDEEFHAAWKERFAATRAEAQATIQAEMEKRGKRLGGDDEAYGGGADSGEE
jgi:Arc/MetJ-type ribon-helix-helix transcriptional regulator